MGHTKIIPLIIRKSYSGEYLAPWNVKSRTNVYGLGKPTAQKLSDWRDKFNSSLKKGECNEHLGIKYWLQCKLEVYNQITKQVVCEYNPPMFEVIN